MLVSKKKFSKQFTADCNRKSGLFLLLIIAKLLEAFSPKLLISLIAVGKRKQCVRESKIEREKDNRSER